MHIQAHATGHVADKLYINLHGGILIQAYYVHDTHVHTCTYMPHSTISCADKLLTRVVSVV